MLIATVPDDLAAFQPLQGATTFSVPTYEGKLDLFISLRPCSPSPLHEPGRHFADTILACLNESFRSLGLPPLSHRSLFTSASALKLLAGIVGATPAWLLDTLFCVGTSFCNKASRLDLLLPGCSFEFLLRRLISSPGRCHRFTPSLTVKNAIHNKQDFPPQVF